MHFVDLHCHLLPGLDDGAKTLSDTQAMLRMAFGEGIREIIATPHYYPGVYMPERDVYDAVYKQVVCWQQEYLPEMRLYRGNEVFLGRGDVTEAIYQKKVLPMADGRYLLVEFHPDVSLESMKKELYRIIGVGMWPILAHAERYRCLQGWRIDSEVSELAYFQVNAASLLGVFGRGEKKTAVRLLKKGMVQFVATDAHSTGRRAPRMREAAQWIYETFGAKMQQKLFFENPRNVIAGEKI